MAGQRITDEDLHNRFTYHSPTPEQADKYVALRKKAYELATLIRELVPPGRQASLAVTAVEEAVMRANAGIAQDTPPDLFAAPPPGGDIYPPAGVGG